MGKKEIEQSLILMCDASEWGDLADLLSEMFEQLDRIEAKFDKPMYSIQMTEGESLANQI